MKTIRHCSIVFFFCATVAYAAGAPEVNPKRHSGGFSAQSNNRLFLPSNNPVPLPGKKLSFADERIAVEADRIINDNKTTALLLIEKGQIVFEKYKAPGTPNAPMFSQSMSKSLTAYTVGNMLCAGSIKSLDDPANRYVPELRGTASGDAPLRHVLSMSSGVVDAKMAGGHEDNQWEKINNKELSIIDVVKRYGKKTINSGQELRYTATDTFTLSLVADSVGGFFHNFENYLWIPAATEGRGFWLYDRDGKPMSASGFSATARDWGRLAMYSIQQLKSAGCIGDFMQAATAGQVPNRTRRVGGAFSTYGYQTWIGNFGGVGSYWWVGYGGQRVGIDPASEKIIVLTSYKEDYMEEIYKLFRQWTK